MAHILVVDDEVSMREFLQIMLEQDGHTVRTASDAPGGVLALKDGQFDLVLTDLRLPGGSGMDVLRQARKRHTELEVVMMTAFATTENAVEAMKAGAYDYVMKPFKVDELKLVLARALERRQLRGENETLRETLKARSAHGQLVGESGALKDVLRMVDKVAPTRTTVLITGESGTGKELVSRAIHARSPRHAAPFVPINCGAIPENLLESELFGHVKGAFTGAHVDKAGLFESAAGGTVFLDEIGEMPLAMQVKLLRVLQERRFRPVGGVKDKPFECRVVAATNKDLEAESAAGNFREDLYFRLNVIELTLPSLRERKADIPLLAAAFVAKITEQQGRPVVPILPGAMACMQAYAWPGNVRELENVIERGVTLCDDDGIDASVLPPKVRGAQSAAQRDVLSPAGLPSVGPEGVSLEDVMDAVERRLLDQALMHTGGKKKKAAELLQLSFRSFRYRLAKHGMNE